MAEDLNVGQVEETPVVDVPEEETPEEKETREAKEAREAEELNK